MSHAFPRDSASNRQTFRAGCGPIISRQTRLHSAASSCRDENETQISMIRRTQPVRIGRSMTRPIPAPS